MNEETLQEWRDWDEPERLHSRVPDGAFAAGIIVFLVLAWAFIIYLLVVIERALS